MNALTYLKNALFYLEKDHPEECFMFVKSEIRKVIPLLGELQEKSWPKEDFPQTKN